MQKPSTLESLAREPEEIDYRIYRFGRSKQAFRGPPPDLGHPYVAVLGGTESYGKYVLRPYPAQLGDELPVGVANWATADAGPTFFLRDPVLLEACCHAEVTVVAVTHAFHNSNRYYSVFPRRNGQVMAVSEQLKALYPGIDFEEFHFVRPMLRRLWRHDAEAFDVIEREIQSAWVGRMGALMSAIESPKVLVWLSDQSPDDTKPFQGRHRGVGPAMVTRAMVDAVAAHAMAYVECVVPPGEADADRLTRVFSEEERRSALMYPSEDMHAEMAEVLYPVVKSALTERERRRRDARSLWQRLGL